MCNICVSADVRYIERQHQGVATVRLIATAAAVIALSGCTTIRPSGIGLEADHNSGLVVDGRDSRGLYREDSLDVVKAYLDWERPVNNRTTFYVVAGAGYKYRERGFYTDGSPWVGNVRTGVRFSFDRH